jgi:DNA invertase Pin-like site-specific DNA recombinase
MAVRQRETPIKRPSQRSQSQKAFGHPGNRSKITLRVGLYARVSTNDQQTLPMQLRALREYAARRGWTVISQVKEVGSGASQQQLREQLIDAARRREIDVVLVLRLDRWGRSVADLLATLQELEHLGVGFVSLTEALDLTTPAGSAMAGLLAVFAEFEREILRERVRAGLAQTRQNSKRLGRSLTASLLADQVHKLRRSGLSKSEIARSLDIGRTSVRRILAASPGKSSPHPQLHRLTENSHCIFCLQRPHDKFPPESETDFAREVAPGRAEELR